MNNPSFMLAAVLFCVGAYSADVHQECFVFIGNPGVGKSTLVNSLVSSQVFASGLSATGVTTCCQSYDHDRILYIDTPGLSDTQLRNQAAREIEQALRKNRRYKIFFVLTLEGGRVKPDDLHTMHRVMEAINSPHKQFNIIVNKVTKQEKHELFETKDAYVSFCDQINSKKHITLSICWIELDRDLEDNAAQFIAMNDRIQQFIFHDSKGFYLSPDQVTVLETKTAEELRHHMQAEEDSLKRELAEQKRQHDETTRRLQEEQAKLDALKAQKHAGGCPCCQMMIKFGPSNKFSSLPIYFPDSWRGSGGF